MQKKERRPDARQRQSGNTPTTQKTHDMQQSQTTAPIIPQIAHLRDRAADLSHVLTRLAIAADGPSLTADEPSEPAETAPTVDTALLAALRATDAAHRLFDVCDLLTWGE